MEWIRRFGRSPPPEEIEDPEEEPLQAVERGAPGVAGFFDGLREDGTRSVLDLGSGSDASLRVYARFARRIRFADLLADVSQGEGWVEALEAIPAQPAHPYDLVFAWDILDRLFPADRPRFVERLVHLSAPGARLHLIVESPESPTTNPRRYTLLDVDRMRYEPTGPARAGPARLLPAEVGRLLAPFEVEHAFTWKTGLREYVAMRRPARGGDPRDR